MKRFILAATMAAALIVPTAAMAAQPDNPGCFGRDRAANIGTGVTGAEWGVIAGERAGDNGDINRAYRAADYCGQYS